MSAPFDPNSRRPDGRIKLIVSSDVPYTVLFLENTREKERASGRLCSAKSVS
jgi:hypothetical protein